MVRAASMVTLGYMVTVFCMVVVDCMGRGCMGGGGGVVWGEGEGLYGGRAAASSQQSPGACIAPIDMQTS